MPRCFHRAIARTQDLVVDGGDGVSVALRERGRTIATVGVIAARDLIVERSEELARICLRHATEWGLR